MQEMWLFGQLNTLGESEVQQKTDEEAKIVGELLKKVLEMQQASGERTADGADRGEDGVDEMS